MKHPDRNTAACTPLTGDPTSLARACAPCRGRRAAAPGHGGVARGIGRRYARRCRLAAMGTGSRGVAPIRY